MEYFFLSVGKWIFILVIREVPSNRSESSKGRSRTVTISSISSQSSAISFYSVQSHMSMGNDDFYSICSADSFTTTK